MSAQGYIRFELAEFGLLLRFTSSGHISSCLGNTLRGGFGKALREMSCVRRAETCLQCELHRSCPYGYLFETPVPPEAGIMRRYTHAPHPFVLRAAGDQLRMVKEGETVEVAVGMFGSAREYFPFVLFALMRLGEIGLGADRVRFIVQEVWSAATGERLYAYREQLPGVLPPPTVYEVHLNEAPGETLTIHFVTPLRLRLQEQILRRADFAPLVSAALRRLELLSRVHRTGEYAVSAAEWVERAGAVRILHDGTRWQELSRHSGRQQQKVPMGGLLGAVCYGGPVGAFRELLDLAGRVHVGKGITYGHGYFRVQEGGL